MVMLVGKESFRLRKMAKLAANQERVLDVGPAEMPNTYLRNERIVALDVLSFSLPANYTERVVGDVMHLPEPFGAGSFDCITAGEILEHLENPLAFIKGCYETLSEGGLLVLSTPNPNSLIERLLTLNLSRRFFYTPDHVMMFPQRWLIRILERAGFDNVKLHSGGFPIPFLGLIPFPRPWCYQTIATAIKRA